MISYLSLSESSVQVSVFSSSCITTVLKKVRANFMSRTKFKKTLKQCSSSYIYAVNTRSILLLVINLKFLTNGCQIVN